MKKIYLSVVIPSYDEMANLQKGVLEKISYFLNRELYDYEVIIVDDGSNDGSIEFVQNFITENPRFQLVRNPHLGKAGAVTSGMLKARGKYILFCDMDQATPISEVNKLLLHIEKEYDMVIGSRGKIRKGSPFIRIIISRASMILRDRIVGLKEISDTQCGFKLFRNNIAKKLFTKINKLHYGFQKVTGSDVSSGFDVELLYLAQKMGYKVKEVGVNWLYVETRRVNPITDSFKGVMDLFKIKVNDLQGYYD